MSHITKGRPTAFSHILRLAQAGVLLVLAACGGGGSTTTTGGSPQETSHAGPVTVTLPSDNRVYWVAYQDGDGPWALAQKTATGFSFQINNAAGKYGVVMVNEDAPAKYTGIGPRVKALFFTRQEVPSMDLSAPDGPTASVQFSILGAPNVGTAHSCAVSISTSIWTSRGCAANNSRLTVSGGTVDTFMTHLDATGLADMIVAQRDVPVVNGTSLVFDFAKGVALGPLQQSQLVNSSPVNGETLKFYAALNSSTASAILSEGTQRSLRYPLMPAALLRPSDYYSVAVTARLNDARRSSYVHSLSGQGQDLQLPSYVNPVTFGLVPGATTMRPVINWTPLKGSQLSYFYAYGYNEAQAGWNVTYSSGWTRDQAQPSYSWPELSGLGWKSSWYLPGGTNLFFFYMERATSSPDPQHYLLQPRKRPMMDETAWSSDIFTQLTLR